MIRRGGGGIASGASGGASGGIGATGAACAVALSALLAGAAREARAEGPPSAEPGAAVDVIDLPELGELDETTPDAAALLAAVAASEDRVTGAAKREQSLGNVASAVTVISGDRLRRMGARTVGEAIATAAGLHLVDDRLSTRVNIRGIQPLGDFNTRILVIIDGTSVTENWSHLSGVGHDVAVSIDEVERIEVIRGPVSSIYGTNAFFGIINIITRGPSVDGRAWGRVTGGSIGGVSAAAGFAVGTVDRQLRGELSANRRLGERLRYDFGRGPDGEGPGVRELGRDADVGAQLQASLSGSYHGTFAQVRGYVYDRTIPFGPYDSLHDDPYTQGNRQLLADVGHVVERGALQLSGRLFGSLYRFDDRATAAPAMGSAQNATLAVVGEARTVGGELRARYQFDEELLGATAGVETSYNDTTSEVEGRPVPPPSDDRYGGPPGGDLRFGAVGLYLEADSAPTRWLTLTAGVRLDVHQRFESGASPRLAAFVSRGNHYGLKLLYAEGFRNPSTYEAEFHDNIDFIKDGTEDKLKPERIRSMEAVAWARPTPATWLRASAFRWKATQIIEQEELELYDEAHPEAPPEEFLRFANIDEYSSLGLEVEASYRDGRGWLAFAGAALTKVRSPQDAKACTGACQEVRLDGSPWATASFGISSPKLGGVAHLSSELMIVSDRPSPAGDRTSPYAGVNLVAYAPSFHGFDVTIGVRNLLGIRQEIPAASDFEREDLVISTVPGEGRELYVRIGHALN